MDSSSTLTPGGTTTLERGDTPNSIGDSRASNGDEGRPLVIQLPPLKPALLNASRLLAETALVPTLLFAAVLHGFGLVSALVASLCWCYFVCAMHAYRARRVPGTLLLCAGMVTTRTAVALGTSSAFIYLLQPVVGSICMAVFFLGSAVIGRPITIRLARDFVHIPTHLLTRCTVQRMFRDVALLWGVSRLISCALSLGMLHSGINAGLFARGVLSPVLTVVSVLVCAGWGWRCLHVDGVRLRRSPAPALGL